MSSEIISHQDHDDQSRRSRDTISPPPPCQHLANFRAVNGGARPFLVLRDCIRAVKPPSGRALIRRDEGEVPRCGSCDTSLQPRLYACVSCATVSCHTHAPAHASSSPPGHEIAVDVDRAELFCCVCCDQVYDRDFDAAVVLAQTSYSATDTGSDNRAAASPSQNQRKRRRIDYKRWNPDLQAREIIVNGSIPLYVGPVDKPLDSPPWGLRGLNNLGNTCFMNSVLQALFHTPPLRNFFLSDGHNRFCCQQKNASKPSAGRRQKDGRGREDRGGSSDGLRGEKTCLACDFDAMFSAMFSGDRTPHTPAKFLYSWWQHAANLASYQQQDAHEFFISVLDGIHEKVEKDHRKPQNAVNGDCCIAHRVFSGILRSDVMCMTCGFTSTTYDPCVDISLDLEPNRNDTRKKSSAEFLASCKIDRDCIGSKTPNHGTSTLLGCLDHFTRPEKLGSDQKFFCQRCQESQESLKQMSIRKLPLVSCFHIKRFEHSPFRKMSVKLDRYLQFPFSLDMAPYLSSSILRNRFGNRIFAFDSNEPDASNEISAEFELFAVVTHRGKLDSGHYVTYLRLSNQWFKCDDAWVTRVNENIVRAAQVYMMFYVQKMLYYKASEKKVVPEDASA